MSRFALSVDYGLIGWHWQGLSLFYVFVPHLHAFLRKQNIPAGNANNIELSLVYINRCRTVAEEVSTPFHG